jgi:hypothetical protein
MKQHLNRTQRQRLARFGNGALRSCLAQSERHGLARYRTIELSPLCACMASHPRQAPKARQAI